MPKKYQDHKAELVEQIKQVDVQPREGPLSVTLTILVTKPKTSKLSFPKPDVDNYAKTVMDAITEAGNIWADDTQVVHLDVTKLFEAPDSGSGTAVSIKPYRII